MSSELVEDTDQEQEDQHCHQKRKQNQRQFRSGFQFNWQRILRRIDALLTLIDDWKQRSENSSPTSPRWVKLREFLSDVEKIGI
jgi:hypothetical protein